MLRIINPYGNVLELAADQVITVDKYNPLFNDADKLLQDISYPGTAPYTENNKIFFGLAHLVETPNNSYTMDVQFYADESELSAGTLTFAIREAGFEFNLNPNLSAVNALLTNIRITEIRTEDSDFSHSTDNAGFESLMQETLLNPGRYPFAFLPVNNTDFSGGAVTNFGFINYFDLATRTLKVTGSTYMGQSPFFKVTYILQTIANYLGFAAQGSFFTDAAANKLYIYTRRGEAQTYIIPSMMYMPNMLIGDFLKQLRERLHLAMDFDLRNKTLTVETFKTIKESPDIIDLSRWIGDTLEQEVPGQQSFTVTLKTDQQDKAFEVLDNNDNASYPPLFALVAGTGDTTLELDCSTLAAVDPAAAVVAGAKYCVAKQTVYNQNAFPGGPPPDLSYTDVNDPSTINNFPLRLIRYLGWTLVTGGFFPNTEPVELDADDMAWYQFQNDSKRLIITAYMPPAVLAGLKLTKKYTHQTAGHNYTRYLIEQISYDAGMNDELIAVQIYARTLNYQVKTKVAIIPLRPLPDTSGFVPNAFALKAYFDPIIHGIDVLNITITDETGVDILQQAKITSPCNPRGTGGVAIRGVSFASGDHTRAIQVQIRQGVPKYILHMGVRYNFASMPGYYQATLAPGFAYDLNQNDTYTIFY